MAVRVQQTLKVECFSKHPVIFVQLAHSESWLGMSDFQDLSHMPVPWPFGARRQWGGSLAFCFLSGKYNTVSQQDDMKSP